MPSTGTVLVADCFDTYSLTLPLFQTPSPYVFSTVSVPAAGGVPWNTFGSNHYINADCTKVGVPNAGTPASNPGPGIYRTFGNVYQSLIWGQWIRINTRPITNVAIWRLCDGQNHNVGIITPQLYGVAHCNLQLNALGTLSLVNGGSGAQIASAASAYPLGSWHFLEAFIYLGDHNHALPVMQGAFTVKLDGAVIMSGTNAQTAFSTIGNGIGYGADTFTMDAEIDNLAANIDFGPYYIMSAPNAGAMLGTSAGVLFQTLFANANGTVDQLVVTGAAS